MSKALVVTEAPNYAGNLGVEDQTQDIWGRLRITNSFTSAAAITSGVAFTKGSAIGYICTSAGEITIEFPDTTTATLSLGTGNFTVLPFSAIKVTVVSGTFQLFNLI